MTCSGLFTALITPFDENGLLDVEGLSTLVERQKDHVQGLTLLGSTGEGMTLSFQERETVIQTVKACMPSMPLMVSCTALSTRECCEQVKQAHDLGASSVLIAPSPYLKPTQEGLFFHYEAVSKSAPLPIIAYQNPGRTVSFLSIDLMQKLARETSVVGIKDSSNDLAFLTQLRETLPDDFAILCGDDILTIPYFAIGACGLVSILGNLLPKEMSELAQLCKEERFTKARSLQKRLSPLMRSSVVASNPIPIKAMMEKSSLPAGAPRMPLTPLDQEYHKQIEEELACVYQLA